MTFAMENENLSKKWEEDVISKLWLLLKPEPMSYAYACSFLLFVLKNACDFEFTMRQTNL